MSRGMSYQSPRHSLSCAQCLLLLCLTHSAITPSDGQADIRANSAQVAPATPTLGRASPPASGANQTVEVALTVLLKPGASFDNTARDVLKAALKKVTCKETQDLRILDATGRSGCGSPVLQQPPGRRRRYLQTNSDPSFDELCRLVHVQAKLTTSNADKCISKLKSSQDKGKFQVQVVKAGFEGGTIESVSLVDPTSAPTAEGAPGASSCPVNGTIVIKVGVSEAMQCNACACISDPVGSECGSVAGNICITEPPSANCTTLQSGFLSGAAEDVAAAATAIVERCPTLDKSTTDVCGCLEDFKSDKCSELLIRVCVQYPSLCMGRVQVLANGGADAVLAHLRDLAGMCQEEQNLLVRSVVITDISSETLHSVDQDRFRKDVAELAMVDISHVTLLDVQASDSTLNVTFVVYTRDPVKAEENIVKADSTGFFSSRYEDATIQGVVASPPPVMEDPGASFSKIRGWQVFLVFVGALCIIGVLVFVAHSNRVFVRRNGLPGTPPGSPAPTSTWEAKDGNGEVPNLEEGTTGRGSEGGTIQSYSPGFATGSSHSLKWQRGGRPALEIDTRSGEEKRQWRTIQMPAPFIRQDTSSDDSDVSEQGGAECDSYSDRTPDGAASFAGRHAAHPSRRPFALKPGAYDPRAVMGDGLADTNWFSIEGDERKSPKKSEASMSEYLSADELEAPPSDEPTPRPSEASNASHPLAVSINCPPSPYGPPTPSEGPRTPSARTPQSRDAPSSLISSSDLEYDVDTGEGRGVSQFQYQGFPLEQEAEVYTKQYVNYLYDAPVSSRSQATNKSGLSEFTGLTERE